MAKRYEGIRRDQEFHKDDKYRDTRRMSRKLNDLMKASPAVFITLMWTMLGIMALFPFTMELMTFFMSILVIAGVIQGRGRTLLFRTPMSSGTMYKGTQNGAPVEYDYEGQKKKRGVYYDKDGYVCDGIYFLGNDNEFGNEQYWFNDSDVRKHMLLFGTTGAGKTEALLSLCYGALLSCSGFIYSDGKGTFELYYKMYNTCRIFAAEDDLLLMSFLTGDEDPYRPTTIKISHSLNPFADATKDAAVQLLVSLLSGGSSGGDGDMWKERAMVLMESVMGLLVYRRDFLRKLIDVDTIRDALILENIYKAWKNAVEAGDDTTHEDYLPPMVLNSLKGYLASLPGLDLNKPFEEKPDTVDEQHGYLFMQYTKLLGSLADMYGYIFNTQLSEINFWDIVVHRRILVVLLPALAKSKNELSMLGKIIIACIKQMMTSGLGKKSEGNLREILNSNPTKSRTPFIVILDEYGYYSVPGAAVMPAQARGLGFFMVFAGQDFAAFAATSKEEAESIVANCKIQACMALQDEKQTYAIFKDKAGMADITITTGDQYNPSGWSLRENDTINYERRDRVTFKDLSEQEMGEMHILFEGKMGRGRFFYAAVKPKNDDNPIRVNQFIAVQPPSLEKIEALTEQFKEVRQRITSIQYVTDMAEDEDANGQDEVLREISELFNSYRIDHESSEKASCATIAHICFNKKKLHDAQKERNNVLTQNKYQSDFFRADEEHEEKERRYQAEKADINRREVKTYGQKVSAGYDELLRKQMAIDENAKTADSKVRSQIKDINALARYPRAQPESKAPREIMGYIEEINFKVAQKDEEYDED